MANFKLKHRHHKNICICKEYKRAGNAKGRRTNKEAEVRKRMKRAARRRVDG